MAKNNVRVKLTQNEKLSHVVAGTDAKPFVMSDDIDAVIISEQSGSNAEKQQQLLEQLANEAEQAKKAKEDSKLDFNKIELKPMFSRLIVKPLVQNPFQELKVSKGGLIIPGDAEMNYSKNPVTGEFEKQKEFIVTGVVIEIGPDVRYIREGDVIYYRVDTVTPVPFFKHGFVSLAETQVIATVNEGLTERFDNVKKMYDGRGYSIFPQNTIKVK